MILAKPNAAISSTTRLAVTLGTRPIIYRMRVTTRPVQLFMLKVFGPGDLQSVHFLTRIAPGLWSY